MKKTLVTGAGGFIGHHLVSSLKAEGHYVIGIDQKEPEFEKTRADFFCRQDLRQDCAEWQTLFQGVDEVYALAADMGGMGYLAVHQAVLMRNNTLIDLNTLEAARQAGVKNFLYASSACVYPEHLQTSQEAVGLSEELAYPANPQEGYGWAKLYGERLCHYYREQFHMKTRVVRFHNIYGPLGTWEGGREKAPAAICRKVAEALEEGKDFIEIWGDGLQTRSFCFVEDCIKGIHLLMAKDFDGAVNLGREELVSINAMADLVMKAAGAALRKVYVPGPQGVRGRNSDNALLKSMTGWSPQIDLETGLRLTYSWIQEQVGKNRKIGAV